MILVLVHLLIASKPKPIGSIAHHILILLLLFLLSILYLAAHEKSTA
jgi:hypothetical protein